MKAIIPANPGFEVVVRRKVCGTLDVSRHPVIAWKYEEGEYLCPVTLDGTFVFDDDPTTDPGYLSHYAVIYPDGRVMTADGYESSSLDEYLAKELEVDANVEEGR